MNEPCPQIKDHFDGPSFGFGLFVGLVITAVAVILMGTLLPRPYGHEILWRTDTGVTCHIDKLYPSANCKNLLNTLGPRLSRVKVK